MKRWTYLIPILALVAIVATAAAPVEAQENEVTSIRPGGTYHIYVTAKKPSDMTLTTNWEIRFYLYNGLNCFTTGTSGDEGGWWNPSGDTWLYTGYWDHRVRNQSWGSTDERTWATYVPVIHSPASTNPADKEMRYPAPVGESYENKMGEIPVGSTIELRARFELRNLQNVTKDEANSTVTFKYGGKTYSSPYTLSTYGDINLDVGGNISQSEGTGEWSYRFDLNTTVLVDNNAPPTGKITMPGVLDVSFLTPSGGAGIPLWMIIVAVVVVLVFIVVAVVAVKMRGGATVSP